jgi:TonB family protein
MIYRVALHIFSQEIWAMIRWYHRNPPAAARRIRMLLFAAAAGMAAASPSAAQLDPHRLLNREEIEQQIDATYPTAQRDSGRGGHVVLYIRVREDGTVDPASVSVRGASEEAFQAAATALVPRMRFAPARWDGRPTEVWTTHTVNFEIRRPSSTRAGAVPPDEGTYELSAVEEMPEIRNRSAIARQIAARFPPELRAAGVSGVAIMRFRVLENGTADPATPSVELTTDPRFGDAAIAVVREARFRPAKVNGRPVKAWVTVPINFILDSSAPADPPASVRP